MTALGCGSSTCGADGTIKANLGPRFQVPAFLFTLGVMNTPGMLTTKTRTTMTNFLEALDRDREKRRLASEAFTAKYPWISPNVEGDLGKYRPEVFERHQHYAVRTGAAHKSMPFMMPIHSHGLERVDGYDWEIFSASHQGTIDGVEYIWGSFVEGIGAFHVMAPMEYVRELSQAERDTWSKVVLGMYGSHTGKHSYNLNSGVEP
ncbi:hypothetical protein [Achromobacter phage Motura]|uniref:Uncharacterized protein n=1 Tax=Achromobacter phage Motura TaxID=2591403 RepID=A0A514CST3_9CAUD|nr:hypothetical protein H1O15_gp257 [Achromobacter phage Motura]QDH83531.1 hypothetical protein [Achromobacter phage Motura]